MSTSNLYGTTLQPMTIGKSMASRSDPDWITEIMDRLARLGYARNRAVDREPRTITITDDEARAIYHLLSLAERALAERE